MSHNTMDLTQGSPLRQLLVFSLPLVAGTLFLLATSLLNILLDYVFLVPVPLGVAGAALALYWA